MNLTFAVYRTRDSKSQGKTRLGCKRHEHSGSYQLKKGYYLIYKIVFLKAGFIPERGLAGFPQFGKNMPHKIYLAESNGARQKKKKNRPKDKNYFF